ncbi:Myb_DNA-bind_3 domain-containing protein [Cephalotus follicularis]|uniref:Myb_DNA-bind_3 domain-containing protein n=1 Tax=Cephalotus follicularis TaxID=3775 RepID=A0A1Q3CII9_CEPFO|nr:Myb_DNA-bind_3 domain-containing protein [Cephalotus follicularis]
MEIQLSSNDRSRTYWTPTMERYFVDLMLEQMHRGNRVGHTFNKQAWTDMLVMFNAKFGSQYDKDALKSRYTSLWKQFNDVKYILCQSGFSWDETQQMVVAEDHVWNAYIKAHPVIRPYKTKAVLNFNDLCLIFAYTNADGRYSRSSHDVDFDDEVQGINIGDGLSNLVPSSNERPKTEWTPAMDQYFIELLLDQLGRGNRISNTFNKQAWTDMLFFFNAKFGPQHGKRVLRHRYKKLSKYCNDVGVILKQIGFYWDDAQQMIAANDNVWDDYVKAHPHARTYRSKTLPNYNDLVLIFGNAVDEGFDTCLPLDKDLEDDNSEIKSGKGRRSLSGSDRTRTYWTPPMDRYFINLLLDQVDKGNKVGQTFLTQAWMDMVTSFNAKFRSHYDKDVLKNRYKHLRRHYNEIRTLLAHSQFQWDETRQMVTAEDSVWDSYIEEHPDARSYRVKTVPSYHKLCVIFGEESSDRRFNRLSFDADPTGEIPVLMTGEHNNEYSAASTDPSRIDWAHSMDRHIIDIMLEQVNGGKKIDDTFNEKVWNHILEGLNEKFGLRCDKEALEKLYICLMKQHDDIGNLLDHGGFMWDETKQMIQAENDVWEAYIKKKPDAISYRDRVLSSYSDLCKIFGKDKSDGILNGQEMGTETDCTVQEAQAVGLYEHLQSPAGNIQLSDQHRKRPTAVLSNLGRSSKAQKTGQELRKALSGAVTLLSKKQKNHKTIENAVDVLRGIPDMDDELLLGACELLEDERKAKTFLALGTTLRKKWLLRKLRPQ